MSEQKTPKSRGRTFRLVSAGCCLPAILCGLTNGPLPVQTALSQPWLGICWLCLFRLLVSCPFRCHRPPSSQLTVQHPAFHLFSCPSKLSSAVPAIPATPVLGLSLTIVQISAHGTCLERLSLSCPAKIASLSFPSAPLTSVNGSILVSPLMDSLFDLSFLLSVCLEPEALSLHVSG